MRGRHPTIPQNGPRHLQAGFHRRRSRRLTSDTFRLRVHATLFRQNVAGCLGPADRGGGTAQRRRSPHRRRAAQRCGGVDAGADGHGCERTSGASTSRQGSFSAVRRAFTGTTTRSSNTCLRPCRSRSCAKGRSHFSAPRRSLACRRHPRYVGAAFLLTRSSGASGTANSSCAMSEAAAAICSGRLAGRVLQVLLEADGALSVADIAARLDDRASRDGRCPTGAPPSKRSSPSSSGSDSRSRNRNDRCRPVTRRSWPAGWPAPACGCARGRS